MVREGDRSVHSYLGHVTTHAVTLNVLCRTIGIRGLGAGMALAATTVVMLHVGGLRPVQIMTAQAVEPTRGTVFAFASVLELKAMTQRQPNRRESGDPTIVRMQLLRFQSGRRAVAFTTAFDRLQRRQ